MAVCAVLGAFAFFPLRIEDGYDDRSFHTRTRRVGFELLHNKSCPAKRTSGPADGITKAGVMAFTIIHPRSNGSGSAQNVSPRSKQTARSTDSSRKARSKNGGTKLPTNFCSPSKDIATSPIT